MGLLMTVGDAMAAGETPASVLRQVLPGITEEELAPLERMTRAMQSGLEQWRRDWPKLNPAERVAHMERVLTSYLMKKAAGNGG